MKQWIPFSETGHGTTTERAHVMYSISAMIATMKKGVGSVTPEDLAGCFGKLMPVPDPQQMQQICSNVTAAVDAAALVFLHSVYENAVFNLMKRLISYDAVPWMKYIEKKQVPFEVIQSTATAEIQKSLFGVFLEGVEKESFPKKVDLVLGVLQPATVKGVIENFDYDRTQLVVIDQLRHKLTHEPSFAAPIDDIRSKLRFLHCTVLLLEELAKRKYSGPGKSILTPP